MDRENQNCDREVQVGVGGVGSVCGFILVRGEGGEAEGRGGKVKKSRKGVKQVVQ